MTRWQGLAAWAKREARAGERLPYAAHVDDHTLLLRDGSMMQSLAITGIPFETEDAEQLNHYQNVRETMWRGAMGAGLIAYHHVIRRRVDVALGGAFPDPVSGEIDRQWRGRIAGRRLFVNDLYVSIVRRPARGKTGWIERIARRFRTDEATGIDHDALRELQAAVTAMAAALQPYGVRVLECYKHQGTECSEPLELLSALYNGELRSVCRPGNDADLGLMLPYKRASFGVDAIERRGAGNSDFTGILSMKEYPAATGPGMLDNVMRLPHEFVLTESFAPMDRQIGRERISLSLRRRNAGDDDGLTERRELAGAKDALVTGAIGFGEHHLTVAIKAQTLAALDGACAEAAAALADFGAIAVREDVNLEPAFWAQFPGNEAYIARRAMVSTANAAGLMSFHNFPLGRAQGNHWGDAIALLETTSATPYFFNFHDGDLGNFSIIGPSGSGKTVVMNFLAAQAQKLAPRTIFFDKDRGSEIFVRAMGGKYEVIRPGVATGLNPLMLEDNADNRAFLRDWFACLLSPANGVLDAEDRDIIARAVDENFDHPPQFRRLSHFRDLLGGSRRPEAGDLAARLTPWLHGGAHGWLFDNERDQLDLSSRVIGFDMTALLDSPALRTPAMMYLFHRIDQRLDGSATIIMIDEGWKALDDVVFSARIRDWMKTLRKRNAIIGFGTQSARDALESRVSSAIVEQCATHIFMPNSRARAEDYCTGFGLSDHELELIRALPAQSRCFLIRKANHSIVARLDLSGLDAVLTILSGREGTVRQLDRLRRDYGDAPAHWYEALTGTPWPDGDARCYLEAAE